MLLRCSRQERANDKWLPEVALDIGICLGTNTMGDFATAWLYFTLSIHIFCSCREGVAGPRLWAEPVSPVSAITSHWFWCIPWLPSYPQLSNPQDLSHFKDFSSSQELYLFLFGSPSSMSRPLPPGTPDKPLLFRPDVYSQTPQFQGANSKLLLETLKVWIWSLTFTHTLNYLVLVVFII